MLGEGLPAVHIARTEGWFVAEVRAVDPASGQATWTESREIPFMDGKECHLKDAFDVARAGDYQALVKLSRANAESCGTGSKVAMQSWYNLGAAGWLAPVRRSGCRV